RIVGRRLPEQISRVRFAALVLQAQIVADRVFRPGGVVEAERDARLRADAVEGADRSHGTPGGLVGLLVGGQIIQDVEERGAVLVLREVEQRPMGALYLSHPRISWIARRRGLCLGTHSGYRCHDCGGTEQTSEKSATIGVICRHSFPPTNGSQPN